MVDIIRALDFIWIPQKYWQFRDNEELYFGNDYNNSGLLRFTNYIYVRILTLIKKSFKIKFFSQNEYYDCCIDTDFLYTFSKYLNLRLIFVEPEFENTGKLGVKVEGKWFNGSMALLHENVFIFTIKQYVENFFLNRKPTICPMTLSIIMKSMMTSKLLI
jgi:hypothetical protein